MTLKRIASLLSTSRQHFPVKRKCFRNSGRKLEATSLCFFLYIILYWGSRVHVKLFRTQFGGGGDWLFPAVMGATPDYVQGHSHWSSGIYACALVPGTNQVGLI